MGRGAGNSEGAATPRNLDVAGREVAMTLPDGGKAPLLGYLLQTHDGIDIVAREGADFGTDEIEELLDSDFKINVTSQGRGATKADVDVSNRPLNIALPGGGSAQVLGFVVAAGEGINILRRSGAALNVQDLRDFIS